MSAADKPEPWVFHLLSPGEKELCKPFQALLNTHSSETTKENKHPSTRAFVGLHHKSQEGRARRAQERRARRASTDVPVVAVVELVDHWSSTYLHNHGTHAVEVLGYASHVLAPTGLVQCLRDGILASSEAYIDHVRNLQRELPHLHLEVPRYRHPGVSDAAVCERCCRYDRLITALANTTWRPERIIDWGLPGLVSDWFDGTKLLRPEAVRNDANIIVFIRQNDQESEVEKRMRSVASSADIRVELFPEKKAKHPDADVERGRQLLTSAHIVATEFSNLAYQVALAGKRVLYCTWRTDMRPVPLLCREQFPNVREASNPEQLQPLLQDANSDRWCELEYPVETSEPKAVLERIEEAVSST